MFSLFFFLCFHTLLSHADNSITGEKTIRDDDGGDNLVSDGLTFKMGFFGFDNSSRYVGIWYHKVPIPTYIWVANREKPLKGRGGSMRIKDNKLVILDGENNEVWSSNVSNPMKNNNNNTSQLVLDDDGNLVLSEGDKVVWESFKDPTDTFVPGMEIPARAGTSMFRSWKSETDPSPGNFTMGVDSGGSTLQILIMEGEKRRWRSGYWDNRVFTGVSNMTGSSLFGFGLNTYDNGEKYFTYTPNSPDKVKFQITWDGYEKKLLWNEDEKNWTVTQYEPYNQCESYNYCGSFAVCDMSKSNSRICSCMKKFEPSNWDEWNNRNWSGGCKRVTKLKAETERDNSSGTEASVGEDGFLEQMCMKLPDFARVVSASNEDCESFCLKNSSCTAYAYVLGIGCMIWDGELVDVKHSSENLGLVLNIRLADSDLGTVKSPLSLFPLIRILILIYCHLNYKHIGGKNIFVNLLSMNMMRRKTSLQITPQLLTSFHDYQVVITAYDFYVLKYRRWEEKDQNLDSSSYCGGTNLPWNRCVAGMEV